MLYSIMQNTNEILHAYCRNMLIATDGLVYHEPYIFPDTTSNKSTEIIETRHAPIWPVSSYFKLYPNPAKDYITIEYKLANEFSNAIVEVVSIGGVHINTFRLFNSSGEDIIDLRGWNSGTYVLKLVVDGKTMQSEKFVKQ